MNENKPDWGDKDRIKELIERFSIMYNEVFWDSISKHIRKYIPFSLLDIGCGPGLFLKEISERLPNTALSGVDEKQEMLEEAKKRVPKAELTRGLADVNFIKSHKKKYDIIYLGLVFHELDNQINFLEAVKKHILNKDGLLIIYDFVIVPLEIYIQAFTPFMSKDNIIQRFPKPAKFTKNDIKYLLKSTGWTYKASYDTLPVATLFIASPQ
jgi:2-polyprenyl-3-methyl-5-hydroxy-6-metoxy-1,4-benzoquinol methylase